MVAETGRSEPGAVSGVVGDISKGGDVDRLVMEAEGALEVRNFLGGTTKGHFQRGPHKRVPLKALK